VEKVIVVAIGGFEVIAEKYIGCDEDYATQSLPECRVFCDLQQQSWQEGVAANEEYILGGASRGPSRDFKGASSFLGENLRSRFY
jgi:hypothetical protein